MTEQMVKQIKKILKKENVKVTATYHGRNGEFRVKVVEFVMSSTWEEFDKSKILPIGERNRITQRCVIDVLRALSKNGLRPEYRTEQRDTRIDIATFDSRYIIFK